MSSQPSSPEAPNRERRERGPQNVVETFLEYFARTAELGSGVGLTLAGGAALYWVAPVALAASLPAAAIAVGLGAVAGVGGLAMMGDSLRARSARR